jgi:purine-binding chemotaxis protein CheW
MTATASRTATQMGVEATRASGDAVQIVTFRIGAELFAADVRAVERVLRYHAPTPLPDVPEWMAGVLEYQRRVVPAIDLRLRFEVHSGAPTPDTRIIVFNTANGWTAGIVDAVLDVSAVDGGRLEAPPPLLHGLAAEYLHGITRRDGQLVVLLNADRVLSSTDQALIRARLADLTPKGAARRV